MRPDSVPVEIRLPTISDDAVVEIHDFLNDFLCLFESHYGAQIHRFYQQHSRENLNHLKAHTRPAEEDPPF